KICEKLSNPTPQPAANVTITMILKSLSAPVTYSYFFRSSKIKLPDIPGKIIAQIAIIPLKKINQSEVGVSDGVAMVIKYATAIPTNSIKIFIILIYVILLKTATAEATIRPKKNDHI